MKIKDTEKELMLMERIGEDGERREIEASEVARVDQIMARQDEISHRLVHLYGKIKEAAGAEEPATVGLLTTMLRDMLYGYFPGVSDQESGRELFDFVLYLVGLLNSAKEAQEQTHETADALLHGIVAMLPADHPVLAGPYFEAATMLDRIAQAVPEEYRETLLGKLRGPTNTYTCGDGVELHAVHALEHCAGEFCVIHRPAPGPWDTWPTSWLEVPGLMGRVCPHGLTHVCIEDLLTLSTGLTQIHDHGDTGCDCPCDLSRVEMVISDEGKLTGFRPITQ